MGDFNQAFASAHNTFGPGHTFSFGGKEFSTNRADGRDMSGRGDAVHSFSGRYYSSSGSFGKAFATAHNDLGPGSSFMWNTRSFATDRADGANRMGHGDMLHREVKVPTLSRMSAPPRAHPTASASMPVRTASSSKGTMPAAKVAKPVLRVSKAEAAFNADKARCASLTGEFKKAGAKWGVRPEVLAAIASRESNFGRSLDESGCGDKGNGYGIMQVDKRFHTCDKSGAKSQAHIDQAAGILAGFIQGVAKKHPGWTKEQQERGGIAAYNFGLRNVQTIAGVDRGTTGNDYSKDVLERAQLFGKAMAQKEGK